MNRRDHRSRLTFVITAVVALSVQLLPHATVVAASRETSVLMGRAAFPGPGARSPRSWAGHCLTSTESTRVAGRPQQSAAANLGIPA